MALLGRVDGLAQTLLLLRLLEVMVAELFGVEADRFGQLVEKGLEFVSMAH
jgi:hypothetical protein